MFPIWNQLGFPPMDCKDLRIISIITTYQKPKTNIREFNIKSSRCEKLLGVKIDSKLKFDCHAFGICKRFSRYINALAIIAPYKVNNAYLWISFCSLSWRRSLSYRNQSIGFHHKSMDWFLYDKDLRHERVKVVV